MSGESIFKLGTIIGNIIGESIILIIFVGMFYKRVFFNNFYTLTFLIIMISIYILALMYEFRKIKKNKNNSVEKVLEDNEFINIFSKTIMILLGGFIYLTCLFCSNTYKFVSLYATVLSLYCGIDMIIMLKNKILNNK